MEKRGGERMAIKKCSECSKELHYFSRQYDSFVCIECNTYTESDCGDKSCFYCAGRPPKPLTDEQYKEVHSKQNTEVGENKKEEIYGLVRTT